MDRVGPNKHQPHLLLFWSITGLHVRPSNSLKSLVCLFVVKRNIGVNLFLFIGYQYGSKFQSTISKKKIKVHLKGLIIFQIFILQMDYYLFFFN